MSQLHYTILALIMFSMLIGCNHHSSAWHDMDSAENIMEVLPDSALIILKKIPSERLFYKEEKARYALLMSMALDKNYIDTTTFDVLQPAIDYYINNDKGEGDDKLRTHYYRGRIYQNQGDNSRAMTSFIRATEMNGISDTLTLARTHVAMSVLFYNAYAPEEMTQHALSAANLYDKLGIADLQMSCYIKAIGGSILSDNRNLADSILLLCDRVSDSTLKDQYDLEMYKLTYLLNYGSATDIAESIDKILGTEDITDDSYVEIARGYMNLGKPDLAEKYINMIDSSGMMSESQHYWITKSDVCKTNHNYKDALNAFIEFYCLETDEAFNKSSYYWSFINEQHATEIKAMKASQNKNIIILTTVIFVLFLTATVYILYYKNKLNKAKLNISETEITQLKIKHDLLSKTNENLELQRRNSELEKDRQLLVNENLTQETMRLETEKKNAELEKDRLALITENKEIQISQMNEEIDSLKTLLQQKIAISKPMENAVRERIEVLNSLIASVISDNIKYADAYEEWKKQALQDYETFMNSTRLAFKVSHPEFISHLEKSGLSDAEINYACLYALGLNGKEVGKYIHCQRHYHISSDIRKKLGLDINDTNIRTFIKRLMEQEN